MYFSSSRLAKSRTIFTCFSFFWIWISLLSVSCILGVLIVDLSSFFTATFILVGKCTASYTEPYEPFPIIFSSNASSLSFIFASKFSSSTDSSAFRSCPVLINGVVFSIRLTSSGSSMFARFFAARSSGEP